MPPPPAAGGAGQRGVRGAQGGQVRADGERVRPPPGPLRVSVREIPTPAAGGDLGRLHARRGGLGELRWAPPPPPPRRRDVGATADAWALLDAVRADLRVIGDRLTESVLAFFNKQGAALRGGCFLLPSSAPAVPARESPAPTPTLPTPRRRDAGWEVQTGCTVNDEGICGAAPDVQLQPARLLPNLFFPLRPAARAARPRRLSFGRVACAPAGRPPGARAPGSEPTPNATPSAPSVRPDRWT